MQKDFNAIETEGTNQIPMKGQQYAAKNVMSTSNFLKKCSLTLKTMGNGKERWRTVNFSVTATVQYQNIIRHFVVPKAA